MSTTIKYSTDLMAELTEAQLSLVSNYNKKIYENNVLKKVEVYMNGVLTSNHYYVSDLPEIADVLLEDSNAQIITNENIDNNTVQTSLAYRENNLIRKRIHVTDINENVICFTDYAIDTDSQIYSKTVKTLYDNGIRLYEFEYDSEGECIYIHNLQEVQEDIIPDDIGVDPDIEFTWTGNEYYQFAYPVIPA